MKRTSVVALFLVWGVSACVVRGSLVGGPFAASPVPSSSHPLSSSATATSSPATSSSPAASSSPATSSSAQPAANAAPIGAAPAGLSEYATRFITNTRELQTKCPLDGTAPDDYGHVCQGPAENLENLYKSVDEKTNRQVAQSKAYLAKLDKTIARWRAEEQSAEDKRISDDRSNEELARAEDDARELLQHLREGRDGKVKFTLISFDNRDAGYVQDRLDALRKAIPEVVTIANACAKGAGKKELCDLAVNRDQYFAKMEALQFDAILAERLSAWTNTIKHMTDEGEVAVINYNLITSSQKLAGELGKDLGAIGTVLGQTNTKKEIDTKLAALRTDFAAAVKARASTNAWGEHAKDARFQDGVATKAVRNIPGLAMVRVAATESTWEVIRSDYGLPVQRNRYVWAMMRKSGESFCRLYAFTVIEDHLGGGRYGEPHVTAGNQPEFYVSACK